MVTVDRAIRGIPVWLMGTYLQELGATQEDGGDFQGDGWHAKVEQIEDFALGSLRIVQIRFQMQGEDAVMVDVQERLEKKLLRGGG